MDDKHKYNQIGKNLENGLSEGLKSGNWSMLSMAINDSVDTVLDDVGKKISAATDVGANAQNLSQHRESYSQGIYTRQRQQKLEREKQQRQQEMAKRQAEQEARKNKVLEASKKSSKNELMVPINEIGKYSSTLYTVVGGVGIGVTGLSLITLLPKIILGSASMVGVIVGGAFLAIFGLLIKHGITEDKRLKLARRFAVLCGSKGYIEIENLANSTGKKSKQVVREIKKLFKLGYFPEGHLDNENKHLMLTDKVYGQYIDSQKSFNEGKREADVNSDNISQEVGERLSSEEQNELQQMIEEGNGYIEQLRVLNAKIPGEVITDKLTRLEGLLIEIFAAVRVHPDQMSRMHELMDYYLPTMIKLVRAYEEYDKVSVPGDDIIEAKKDIENTLDTINIAFQKLLNNLFKDSVWDVTTDAQVLKTVLAQKGLAHDMKGE